MLSAVCHLRSYINSVAYRCCCGVEFVALSSLGLVRYNVPGKKEHQHEHKYEDHLRTNVIFKQSLHFTPACHLTEVVAEAEVAAARGSGV